MLTMIMPVKWRLSSGTAGEKTHSNGWVSGMEPF